MSKLRIGENDLATVNPMLAMEWHPTRNGTLTPQMVTAHSNKKMWWQCKEGHEWTAVISSRNSGANCPYCSGRKAVPGYNDLATKNPTLAMQWHTTKNGELTPQMVRTGTNKKVWWECEKGHEWTAAISSRSNGSGCPYCAGQKVLSGYNDLASQNPMLAAEWHPTKNGALTPQMVTAISGKKVWWQCKSGHEWQATVAHRSNGCGCPYCSGKMVLVGFNDLATMNPALAAEWHPTKNGELTPQMVTVGCDKKVWWQCENGHEWKAFIYRRSSGNRCPYCANQKLLCGYNDLAAQNPILAAEWHPTKNEGITPNTVAPNSHRKVWWQCKEGHEWIAAITDRNKGRGCPYCSGRRAIIGYNDLATRNPLLAAQWHPTRNGDLTPQMVTVSSSKKVWWLCGRGHEWTAPISNRTNGCGCPYCSGKLALVGYNDLATINPVLAAEWHPTKNGELTPQMVTVSAGKKVWWRCKEGHEWEAIVNSRNSGNGCPYCVGLKKYRIKGINDEG